MDSPPNDRALSERRMQVYERCIRAGQFRPCVWAIAECDETGSTYRVNGKHTSHLLSSLAGEFPDLFVTYEIYSCDTLEDVGRLYGTFDASITLRSSSDINRAFAGTIPELAGLPRRIIDSCATGMAGHLYGGIFSGTGRTGTAPERAERLLEHPDFVCWVAGILDTSKHLHICRAGVVGAMFATWNKSKKQAEEFWVAVRDETGDKPTRPDRQLSRWLLMTTVGGGIGKNRPEKRTADAREMYVRSIHMWNAWREGTEVKIIKYHQDAKAPAVK